MTTNTYQSLCDSVEAYEEPKGCTNSECAHIEYCLCSNNVQSKCKCIELARSYPPKSADQRERLEELILTACEKYFDFIGDWEIELSSLSKWRFKDGTYEYEIEKITNYNESQADSEIFVNIRSKSASDALYALTHKLVQENVLSKEEVKEALIVK